MSVPMSGGRPSDAVTNLHQVREAFCRGAGPSVAASVRELLPDLHGRSGSGKFFQELLECFRKAVFASVEVSRVEEKAGSPLAPYNDATWAEAAAWLRPPEEPHWANFAPDVPILSPAALDSLAGHAGALVAGRHLGYVIYQVAGGTAAYSYILRRVTIPPRAGRGRPSSPLVASRPAAPLGERNLYGSPEKFSGKMRIVREEHVHHLRDAREVSLETYQRPFPARVELLLYQLPEWIRPSLRVIEGTIVQEEVYGLDEETQEVVLTRVTETWKASPALVLGDLVLTGWSSDDLGTSKNGKVSVARDVLKWAAIGAATVAVTALLPPALRWLPKLLGR